MLGEPLAKHSWGGVKPPPAAAAQRGLLLVVEEVGNLGEGHVGLRQVALRQIPAGFIFDVLEGGPLLAEAALQGARMHVEGAGDLAVAARTGTQQRLDGLPNLQREWGLSPRQLAVEIGGCHVMEFLVVFADRQAEVPARQRQRGSGRFECQRRLESGPVRLRRPGRSVRKPDPPQVTAPLGQERRDPPGQTDTVLDCLRPSRRVLHHSGQFDASLVATLAGVEREGDGGVVHLQIPRRRSQGLAHGCGVTHRYGEGAQDANVLAFGEPQPEIRTAQLCGGAFQQVDQRLEADETGELIQYLGIDADLPQQPARAATKIPDQLGIAPQGLGSNHRGHGHAQSSFLDAPPRGSGAPFSPLVLI
jgi:hypothetical protein